MSAPVIEVESLGKVFQLGEIHREWSARLVERLRGRRAASAEVLHALADINFVVEEGEVFGVIGPNGAGKSTLLKILAGITDPSSGNAVLHGRIGSLLEVGTGFHPDLTGKENIFLNGTILGLRRREILDEYDRIVDFAGLEAFMDTPVKRYSSGMQVRLAFAVAAHLRPEILLIDEVLAVGDMAFQRKCLGAMKEVAGGGRTVLFVSHNMAAVGSLCHRTLLLRQGRVAALGPTDQVIETYIHSIDDPHTADNQGFVAFHERKPLFAHSPLLVRAARLVDDQGYPVTAARTGESLRVEVVVEGLNQFPSAVVGLTVRSVFDQKIFHFNTAMAGGFGSARRYSREHVRLEVQDLPLMAGAYSLDLLAFEPGVRLIDRVDGALSFDVVETDLYGGGYRGEAREGFIAVRGTCALWPDEGTP
ncbi:MAG: ABC transporter ATP-binding protein [Mollicutes bacterium]|jgi:lipopolysaccharide transport system ATP-binding protein|nr:ABC transporter ATP-binding protein [Mollicutes bacterium]